MRCRCQSRQKCKDWSGPDRVRFSPKADLKRTSVPGHGTARSGYMLRIHRAKLRMTLVPLGKFGRKIALAAGLLSIMLVAAGNHVSKFYFAPRETLQTVWNACASREMKNVAVDAASWIREHPQTNEFNPFFRKRDALIERCVQEQGWCSIALSPHFAPKDWIARRIYLRRYAALQGDDCTNPI
jgi:hypothetical protein